jgi:hypothetical protein
MWGVYSFHLRLSQGGNMVRIMSSLLALFVFVMIATAAQDVASAVEGTVKKVDASTNKIVIASADGTEHTLSFTGKTAFHGAEGGAAGLTEGTKVVAHCSKRGTEDVAREIDKVGEGGLKTSEGTVSRLDRGGKVLAIKTADGTEETYRLTDRAAKDVGKDLAKGAEKPSKVTVYYTESGGRKIAHFFKAAV